MTIEKLKPYLLAIVGIAIVVLIVALFTYNHQSKRIDIVYQPTSACLLLTKQIAQEFLGDKVLGGTGDQEIGDTGMATSDCSYTDTNEDENAMRVIAVRCAAATTILVWRKISVILLRIKQPMIPKL